jgi:hypothetical protein
MLGQISVRSCAIPDGWEYQHPSRYTITGRKAWSWVRRGRRSVRRAGFNRRSAPAVRRHFSNERSKQLSDMTKPPASPPDRFDDVRRYHGNPFGGPPLRLSPRTAGPLGRLPKVARHGIGYPTGHVPSPDAIAPSDSAVGQTLHDAGGFEQCSTVGGR